MRAPDTMRMRLPRRRKRLVSLVLLVVIGLLTVDVLSAVQTVHRSVQRPTRKTFSGRVLISAIHWNNAPILKSHWNDAVVSLIRFLGPDTHVSILESGSRDDSKAVLTKLGQRLDELHVRHNITLNPTTHQDEISQAPGESGWVDTPRGKELRRIPYLSQQRDFTLAQLKEARFDKILFLNDVVFTVDDAIRLLETNGGEYAAACALDFARPPHFYDTFALRDSDGHEPLMQSWPYFRSSRSRSAIKTHNPVPVASCWNGMVAMDAAPFYDSLHFRGIADSLAAKHLEGSECCLIHADNPLSTTKGVWVNPRVRVGYSGQAYNRIHGHFWSQDNRVAEHELPWLTLWQALFGVWQNRFWRWFSTDKLKLSVVDSRVAAWTAQTGSKEPGRFCLINEMQVLVHNGWAHV